MDKLKTKKYLDDIIHQLIQYSQFDFSNQLRIVNNNHEYSELFASIAVGVNILGEELNHKIGELEVSRNDLKKSNVFLKQITNHVQELIFVYDQKTKEIVYKNKCAKDKINLPCVLMIDNELEKCRDCTISDMNNFSYEYDDQGTKELFVNQDDGVKAWYKVVSKPFDMDGGDKNVNYGLTNLVNVTDERVREVELIKQQKELRNTLNENEILLQEVHHRVKNNLQIIVGLVDLQVNRLDRESEGATQLLNVKNRVNSIAMIHEKLYQSNQYGKIDMSVYSRNLISSLVSFFGNDNVEVKYEIEPEIFLSLERAIPFGLIVNELISNSYKHAFNDDQKGEILVSFSEKEEGVVLEIKDNGQGLTINAEKKEKPLGMKLIHLLSLQLKAILSTEKENGYTTKIIVPRLEKK